MNNSVPGCRRLRGADNILRRFKLGSRYQQQYWKKIFTRLPITNICDCRVRTFAARFVFVSVRCKSTVVRPRLGFTTTVISMPAFVNVSPRVFKQLHKRDWGIRLMQTYILDGRYLHSTKPDVSAGLSVTSVVHVAFRIE